MATPIALNMLPQCSLKNSIVLSWYLYDRDNHTFEITIGLVFFNNLPAIVVPLPGLYQQELEPLEGCDCSKALPNWYRSAPAIPALPSICPCAKLSGVPPGESALPLRRIAARSDAKLLMPRGR